METHTLLDQHRVQITVRHKDKSYADFLMTTIFPNHKKALHLCKLNSMGTILRIIDNSTYAHDALNSIYNELSNQFRMTGNKKHIKSIVSLITSRAIQGQWKCELRKQFIQKYAVYLLAFTRLIIATQPLTQL